MVTNKYQKLFVSSFSIFLFIFLWEIIARSGIYNINLFPPPTIVGKAFYDMLISGQLFFDTFVSLQRALIGYILGASLGIIIGIFTGRYKILQIFFVPLIQLLRPIPPISYVPLAILWFGLGETSKYFLVFVGVFFPVWMNTFIGVSNVEETYIWAARSLGAKNRRILYEIILPASLPHIIAGMRTSIAIAFYCLVAAEIAGAFSGVAYRISVSHLVFRVDKMMAGLIVLGVMSFFADKSFTFGVNKFIPWLKIS